MLITVHHIIPIIEKNNFLVLGERWTDGIGGSTCAGGKKLKLTLVKQR